ncbi:MAG: tyrosine--tRNA ligase [Bacteroidia bacterium]|nr:tyrosine--tRNA ligase [Bacteroidia bacterium]MDW8089710.1 tyrosine--tRNA ligase [Bacteroidia bacterium]
MAAWLEPLKRRYLVQDHTPLPDTPASIGAAYLGIDPTADSLHLGHLVPLQLLYHLAQLGIKPIVVIGGATARIGDPSGKKAERPLLAPEVIQRNTQAIAQQVARLLPLPFILVDNYEWLSQFSLLDFLRTVGKHITVSYLLAKETIAARLEGGLSFTEFSYPLLQAYDFYHLFQREGCRLQIGGADQWGNITTGIELVRRLTGVEVYGLTCPLLVRADGTKFGKTESGANIWLSADKTSPYAFYQFWIGQADADMPRLLGVFSTRSWEAIEALLRQHEQDPARRLAQKALAYEMTARLHGSEVAQTVQRISEVIFSGGDLSSLEELTPEFFAQVVTEMPHGAVASAQKPILEALVEGGILRSKSEGRQLIQQGGLAINRQKVPHEYLSLADFPPIRKRYWLVQRGRKHFAWLHLPEPLPL